MRWSFLCLLLAAVPAALGFQAGLTDAKVTLDPRSRARAVDFNTPPSAHLRIDSELVLIPVHVTTAAGLPVTDLTKENFRVFEDDQEQTIGYFAKDDAPVSVGFVFDSSASMHNKVKQSSEAAAQFFKSANREDEFFLVDFNEKPRLAVPFTSDTEEVYNEVARTRTHGRTALLDAIHMALAVMKTARHQRKALVVVSDGGDNRSRRTFGQVKNATLESDVQIYAMGIFDSEEDRKRTREEANGPQLLDEIAQESGGRHYRINAADLPEIASRIGNELRNEYLLGYHPSNVQRDGKYRKVRLQLVAPAREPSSLRVDYRKGYYPPNE
jgi:Ca-activated chloride channel family protein